MNAKIENRRTAENVKSTDRVKRFHEGRRQYGVYFNEATDADIIEYLDKHKGDRQKIIAAAIRKAMKAE